MLFPFEYGLLFEEQRWACHELQFVRGNQPQQPCTCAGAGAQSRDEYRSIHHYPHSQDLHTILRSIQFGEELAEDDADWCLRDGEFAGLDQV